MISLFNNDNSAVVSGVNQTTGILLSLDASTKTASLMQSFSDPLDAIFAVSQGSMQVLPDSHVVMGFGSVPKMKEYDANGHVVLSVAWGEAEAVQSYRTYKAAWVGKPTTKPDVAACWNGNATKIHMSWNGATEVKRWNVFGGVMNGTLSEIMNVERTGFETIGSVGERLRVVRAEAIGEGIQTGASEVVAVTEC